MKNLADVGSLVENFDSFGVQLNSFVDEIDIQVRKRVAEDTKFSFLEKSINDTDTGRSTWIDIAVSLSIPIKSRSNGKLIYLSFVVELTSERIFGEQLRAELTQTPLVHVAISSSQAAFDKRVSDCWIAQIPPASDEDFQLDDSVFWVWSSEGNATKRGFDLKNDHVLFSYPLKIFAGPAEVTKHLVDPLVKILNGDSLSDALQGAPLLRYRQSDDKLSYSLQPQT